MRQEDNKNNSRCKITEGKYVGRICRWEGYVNEKVYNMFSDPAIDIVVRVTVAGASGMEERGMESEMNAL